MKNKIIRISAFVLSLFLFVTPVFVFAQIVNPLGENKTDIQAFIATIITYIVKIGGVVAFFAYVLSGFYFVKAQGNPTELTKAKDIFINTSIGAGLLIGAQLIANILSGTINSITK